MATRQRRAFTGARGGGRVTSGGDPELAAILAAALAAPAEHPEIAESLTHRAHSYPARMHPATARSVIGELAPSALLDPFCGSGTILVEAAAAQIRSVGIDANPLAARIARTKCWRTSRDQRRELVRAAGEIAREAIERGKAARRAGAESPKTPPRRRAIAAWFQPHVFAELETVLALIRERGADPLVPHLEVVLSSIIHRVSRRSSDTDRTRVQRQIGRGAASRRFRDRAAELAEGLEGLAAGPEPEIAVDDAREWSPAPRRFDLVLSSPPYPGTYDYSHHHDLRLAFLGLATRELEDRELGARRHFGRHAARGLRRWRGDMEQVFTRIGESLAPGGLALLLVGDSIAGHDPVRADEALPPLAAAGGKLELVAWAAQPRRPLGGRERQAFVNPPKREHLLAFRRAGGA
jgi:16S rRNA G966 N2-methylase RsmD